ncbi:MAG: DUF3060 domain-containing protein [Deltaproteobacteria bacterium]|nr:DUF3060 domain-containing protein [Deltaproteobacteria bacterium]
MKTLLALLLLSTTALADVNEIDNNKTHAVDCAKDATVRVSGNGNTFTLKGTCKSVQISGNKNTVKGDGAASVALSGNENTVTLTIENLAVSGDKNTVSYKGKKPTIADTGDKNAVNPAK